MTTRINGAATADQVLTGSLQYYVCYASSPGCFVDPKPNPPASEELSRLVNIQVTGNPLDQSQKNFEVFLMSIGLRAMPVLLSDPIPIIELADHTPELSGEGFIWKFAVERGVQFFNFTPYGTPGPVGLLVDDIDGIIIPSGVRITTVSGSPSGWAKNVVFTRMDFI
jgi:hypothetical protein